MAVVAAGAGLSGVRDLEEERRVVGRVGIAAEVRSVVRLAYADPPYPGRAHLYADHPDFAGEVAFHELIASLEAVYDGWALSTSAESLGWMLPLCPRGVRVLAWVKHTIAVGWEPVLVMPAREPDRSLRDWIQAEPDAYQWREKPPTYVIGQKPEAVCLWIFAWLGAQLDDDLDDLYPGSGNVARAWSRWQSNPVLPVSQSPAAAGRARRRAAERALREHPTLLERVA